MELHLDMVGGLAGDMFIAALLDAFPQHEPRVHEAVGCINGGYPVVCTLLPHRDQVLTGRRFEVKLLSPGGLTPGGVVPCPSGGRASAAPRVPFAAALSLGAHVSWTSIRARITDAPLADTGLTPGAKRHALAIFQLLADAEASVHGVAADDVAFHEVGAWDSVADIVGAAALIDALGAKRWSASPAPLGRGQVRTAHGMMPVPAPAAACLLMGMPMLDDGIGGERVTPTGAAILRYLCPPGAGRKPPGVRTLVASGTGFGRRALPGLSNHVRVLCFEEGTQAFVSGEIGVLEFEVDDQSGEDLAAGLDRLRGQAGVLDVTQSPVYGKKGRMMLHVCVLVRQVYMDGVVDACFRETTTLGLRRRLVQRVGLQRRLKEIEVDGQRLRVKVADRPGGATAKVESDDVLGHAVHARRSALRRRAERAALRAKHVEVDA